ncbi:retrotransposon protein, putative, ty1-copia subclass [Tanacetum coccineum]
MMELFEKRNQVKEYQWRAVDLEKFKKKKIPTPFEITSNIPHELVEVEEHSLGDLNEPTSYKAAMLDSESNKWIDAMNAEIQSIMDNMVWVLVDLPPGCKIVGSRWLFKKKTDMDGIVHVYKARLVAKGYTQLYRVDYEETFSPVADIRAIRILISIAAYYDYEIWQMDIEANIGNFVKMHYMDKILKRYKMDNSKRGHIPMQERLHLNKTQGAQTPKKVNRMKNVPYASGVGSIMYAVFMHRPDVAILRKIDSDFKLNPV